MPAKTPCRYHLRNTCFRGTSCPFLHSPSSSSFPSSFSFPSPFAANLWPQPPPTVLRAEAPEFKPPCRFFLKGYCSRGSVCKFLHQTNEAPQEPNEPEENAAVDPDTETIVLSTHTVTFGAGLSIISAVPNISTTSVTISNLPPSVTAEELTQLLTPFGLTSVDIVPPIGAQSSAQTPIIALATLTSAQEAITALNGTRLSTHTVTVALTPSHPEPSLDASRLTIMYPAPTLSATAHGPTQQPRTISGHKITYTTTPTGLTELRGLPRAFRRIDIQRALGTYQVRLAPASYHLSVPETTIHIRTLLEAAECRVLTIELVSTPGSPTVRLSVRLASAAQARAAVRELNKKRADFLGGARMRVWQVFTAKLRTAQGVVRAVKGQLDELRKAEAARFTRVRVFGEEVEGAPVFVLVSGPEREAVVRAKAVVRDLILGEIVRDADGKPLWDDGMVKPRWRGVLRGVEKNTGAYIHYDARRRQLTAHGPPPARTSAAKELLALQSPAPEPSPTPAQPPQPLADGTCPVCLCPAENPTTTLPCGHTYCTSCFTLYLSSISAFPVPCIACAAPLPLRLLPAPLRDKAWSNHVSTRPATLRFCPTPDCKGVIDVTPDVGAPHTCADCLVEVCTRCIVPMHDGMTCVEWIVGLDVEGQRRFGDWASGRDVRVCGAEGCGVMIEKVDGCNHVQCGRCKTHMCWVCGKVWETPERVYGHMRRVHGGIGVDEEEFGW